MVSHKKNQPHSNLVNLGPETERKRTSQAANGRPASGYRPKIYGVLFCAEPLPAQFLGFEMKGGSRKKKKKSVVGHVSKQKLFDSVQKDHISGFKRKVA